MICVSLMEKNADDILKVLSGFDFAEVRLDGFRPTPDDAKKIFSHPGKLIATMRPGDRPDEERLAVLVAAIEAGADYVDVELDSPPLITEGIMAAARRYDCGVIVSFHDFAGTPTRKELGKIVDGCFSMGADIAKIACVTNSTGDCARLLGVLDDERPIVAVGMGKLGRITRIAAPLLGSPFTFASPSIGKETAEGQIDASTLKRIMEEIGSGSH